MKGITDYVNAVRSRQQRQWMLQCVSWGAVLGGVAGCAVGVGRLMAVGSLSWQWIIGALLLGPICGVVFAILKPRQAYDAAVAIDQSCGLKDRISTALNFLEKKDASPLRELQISDAANHVEKIDPKQVAPIAAPRSWIVGASLSAIAIVIGLISTKPDSVSADIVVNDVVASQADRVEDSLKELEQFNDEDLDPEVEELLKELAEKIEELKQPGMDPKEALAKLSEMESALQEQQEQLNVQNTEAALQEIGQAISLAEPLEAAGQAMSQGEMEKAAEELEKLEMPELDRKTEKAVTEKLNQVEQNSGNGAKTQLKQAVAQLAQGLSKGDRSKFKDGVEGLAGQCKKQGRRKRLSDLLRKQCQCLSECKGECESQCKSMANSKKKGGNNWGLGASGNEPGDKTGMLKTGPQMQVTGQESDQGDVDIETMSSSEQAQEAVRQYRSQAEKYEQLSESVLSSEPIPLGHRQTIRRYFEMIRPQSSETDKVFSETESE